MQEKIVRRGNFFPQRTIGEDSDLVPDGVDDLGTTFFISETI